MYKPRLNFLATGSEVGYAVTVNLIGLLRFLLRFIDRCIGSGVDHQLRLKLSQYLFNLLLIADIQLITPKGYDVDICPGGNLQLLPKLAICTHNQYFHM